MESNMVYNMNIMELIKKEDAKKEKTPFIDRNLWRGTLEGVIDLRAEQFPTLNICDECTKDCKQVEVTGLLRFFCGIRGLVWKK